MSSSAKLLLVLFIGHCAAYSVVQEQQPHEEEAVVDHAADIEDGRGFDHSVLNVDKDKQDFVDMINALLWDADDEEGATNEAQGSARQLVQQFRRRGLLQMPMPEMFREEGSFTGKMYNSFMDQCYGVACKFGLGGLASSITEMLG